MTCTLPSEKTILKSPRGKWFAAMVTGRMCRRGCCTCVLSRLHGRAKSRAHGEIANDHLLTENEKYETKMSTRSKAHCRFFETCLPQGQLTRQLIYTPPFSATHPPYEPLEI
jgi:hypothetical protein